jgi:hypothetical protein
MPSARSRNINDTHPVARWLFQAADLGPAQTLVLEFRTVDEARTAARSLRHFRDRSATMAPGTYEPSAVDPKGEGRGYFDHIEIRLRNNTVALGLRVAPSMPEPTGPHVISWQQTNGHDVLEAFGEPARETAPLAPPTEDPWRGPRADKRIYS